MKTYDELTAAGIPCTVILDSAVAYMISKVDLVLTGAEGVVESGGILNALGTYQIALIAKAANKPFYSCAERFVHRISFISKGELVLNSHECFFAASNSSASFPSPKTTCPSRGATF